MGIFKLERRHRSIQNAREEQMQPGCKPSDGYIASDQVMVILMFILPVVTMLSVLRALWNFSIHINP